MNASRIPEALRAPAWVWIAAAAPRLLLCLAAALDPALALRGDSTGYLELAANLLSHGNFTFLREGVLVPDTFRTPGYPLFLVPLTALFSSPVLPAALLQSLLGVLTAVLGWSWLRRSFGPRAAALGAAWLCLDPVLVLHTPLILTETLFNFLLMLALVRTWDSMAEASARGAAISGLLWGLTALVRPVSFYLPPLLCWIWRRRAGALALFLAAAYFLPAAWMLRNKRVSGHFLFSSLAARDSLRYPAAGVESLRTGRPVAELDVELRTRVEEAHPAGFPSETERSLAYGRAAKDILTSHPLLLARYIAWGAVKTLGTTGLEMLLEWVPGRRQDRSLWNISAKATGQGTLALLRRHPWLIPLQVGYMLALAALYLMGAWGWGLLWRAGRRGEATLLAGCFAYLLALSSTQGQYRYRIPLMPLLAAGAAATLAGAGAPRGGKR